MASVSASYRKSFICDVLREVDEQSSKSELASSPTISKTILKTQVTGVITGIKRFQQRTVYTDTTGDYFCAPEPASSVPGRGIRVVQHYLAKLQEFLKFDFKLSFTIPNYNRNALFQHQDIKVDDGTGTLDCILWKNEPALQDKILELKKDVKFGNVALPADLKNCALSLLKKAEASTIIDEELYVHGDTIWCLGNVNIFRGNPKLDIHHHHKELNVNAETLWILDVLTTKQNDC